MTPDRFDLATLIASRASGICPACGRRKRYDATFCYDDYTDLRPATRATLNRKVDDAYLAAFGVAMKEINAKEFHAPQVAAGRTV